MQSPLFFQLGPLTETQTIELVDPKTVIYPKNLSANSYVYKR